MRAEARLSIPIQQTKTLLLKVKRPSEGTPGSPAEPLPAVAALPLPARPGSTTSDDGSAASLAALSTNSITKEKSMKKADRGDEGELGSGIRRLRESEKILLENNAKLQVWLFCVWPGGVTLSASPPSLACSNVYVCSS